MVDDYRTDEEQIEMLKKWWQENGTMLVGVVAVVSASMFGWQYWENSQISQKNSASVQYQQIVGLYDNAEGAPLDDATLASAKNQTEALKNDHSGSTYAHYAALMLAKQAVLKKDYKAAEAELKAIVEQNKKDDVHSLAALRLAKVQFADGRGDEALAVLEGNPSGALEASFLEVKGDIYLSQSNDDAARDAFQKAVDLRKAADVPVGRMTEMKLKALAAPDTAYIFDAPGINGQTAAEQESESAKEEG